MKAFLVAFLAIFLLAHPALAGIGTDDISSEWGKLTPTQQAEMAAAIAKKAAETQTPPKPLVTVEAVEPWLTLIDHMSEGLVKLARELGVTANELLVSPVGIITVGLIAYTVMGEDLVEVGVGLLWAALTFPLLILFFFKSVVPVKEYAETKKAFFGREYTVHKPIRRKVVFGDGEGFNVDWVFVIMLAINGIVTLAILT